MLALIGLGNPCPSNENNRHNVGFMLMDSIKNYKQLSLYKNRFDAKIINTKINNTPILLVKPQTYMNESGASISKIMNFYKLDRNHIIVFHDDIDIELGKVKTKIGGGNGGHNGIKSIDYHIGKNYRRFRIGIGHPGEKSLVNKHVLGNFKKNELIVITSFINKITKQVDTLIDSLSKNLSDEISLIIKIASKIE